jgi:hypothetical protein
MESTGIYWTLVHAILEGVAEVHLVNPLFIKNLPGRKTNLQDSVWHPRMALIEAAHAIIRGGLNS